MTQSSEATQPPGEVARTIPAEPSEESRALTATGSGTQDGPEVPVTEPEPAAAPGIAGEVSAALSGLADRPVEEHPEVYEAVHRRLGDTLSGIDHV